MKEYFKGWYFKAQNTDHTVAVIPAMHIGENGEKSASIQVIADNGVWYATYPYEEFDVNKKQRQVRVGKNVFSEQGLKINMDNDDIKAIGVLNFDALTPIQYDIMGPFCYVPFMECRHSVYSMRHAVNGQLLINNQLYDFTDAVGYTEGDRGRSFPSVYAWTQCHFGDNSLMLSAADIPLGIRHFTGIIGVILLQGKEYRLATYLGAKARFIGDDGLVIQQGKYTLTAKLLHRNAHPLKAPVHGHMTRFIRESPSCTAYYHLQEDHKTLFEFESDRASFEYEFDS